MPARLLRVLARMTFSVLFVSAVVFVLIRLSGDPSVTMLPYDATEEDRAAMRRAFGWDLPIHEQYVRYLSRLVQGDLGISVARRQPAIEVVLERVPATLELAVLAIAVVALVGITLGVLAAARPGSAFDYTVTGASYVAQSMPSFWLGIMLVLVFSVWLSVLPTSQRTDLASRILPVATLASVYLAQILMLVRQGMLEALGTDYVRTARAKGLPDRLVRMRHALRNVLLPVITVLGLNFGDLLGGAIVTESVFAWPGMGRLLIESVFRRDFPVVQAAALFLAVGIASVNALVDVAYGVIDPRIRRAH